MKPRPAPLSVREEKEFALKLVQERVMSILVFVVAAFPIGGLIGITAVIVDQGRVGAGVGLMVMCALIGMVAASTIRLIRQLSPLSPLVLIGAVPAAVASIFLF